MIPAPLRVPEEGNAGRLRSAAPFARRAFLWLAFVALLGGLIFGLIHDRLLYQSVWTAQGLRRFLIFAAGYAVFFVAVSSFKARLFPIAAGVLALLYTLVAVGPVAVLAVAVVLLSSFVVGETILVRGSSIRIRSAPDFVLAMLVGLSIYMFVISMAAAAPVHYRLAYLAAVAIPLAANRRAVQALFSSIPRTAPRLELPRSEWLAAAALIFVLLAHWLVVLQPEVGSDALAVHLMVPGAMESSHRWSFDVTQHLWAVMPMGGDWAFTLLYMLGGEAAARLFNLALLVCLGALLFSRMRPWLSRGPALLLVALFAATPLVQLVTGSLFVENLWALLCFGGLILIDLYRERGDARYLYAAYILLGAAASTKFGALAFLPPCVAFSGWALWKSGPPASRRRQACVALLCFALFAAPPYIAAFLKTGSPFFPYLTKVFPSRYPELAAGAGAPLPGPRLGWTTPFDLTFRTSLFNEVQDGATGFQYFLFLPLAVLLVRRKSPRLAWASGLTALTFGALVLAIEQDVRYVYAALAPATLVIAAGFASLQRLDRPLYRVAIALAAAVFLVDVYFLPSSNWMHKDFVINPASRTVRQNYVAAHAPERNLIAYMNRAHRGSPVAFFESSAIAGLNAASQTTTWHTVAFYRRTFAAASPAEFKRLLGDYGLGFVIAPRSGTAAQITTTPEEAFLENCVQVEAISGNYFAGKVKKACGTSASPSIAAPGEYDDRDRHVEYAGIWFRGRFAPAFDGTLTYSAAPGASLILRFTGTEAFYLYTKAFNRGIAEVLLDGVSQGALDLYSPDIHWQTATPFRAHGPGPHTLEIRVTGQKNPASTGIFVDVDSLVVR